jgi:crotonobetainyl-CoA:carnitine CoA-transferase CaiB-like acyl-CoA transferase
MIVSLPHATAGTVNVLGIPPKLSETPGAVRSAPPRLGEHTDTILRELGFAEATILDLRSERVIG